MSLFSAIRSTTISPRRDDRSVNARQPLPSQPVDEVSPLPRQLLVSLAAITADVLALQDHSVDTPQVHAALGSILARLDGIVDSIYGRATDAK